jgi:hypothetical protein
MRGKAAEQTGDCNAVSRHARRLQLHARIATLIERAWLDATAKRVPIPVAATGGAAAEIWRRVKMDYDRYCGKQPKKLFNALDDRAASPDRLAKSVEEILAWLKENDTSQ